MINPVVSAKYGIEFGSFVIENVSVPAEVEEAIDKRSSMAAVGNLNDYVKYQMGQGMANERGGGGGAAGMATELAVGMAMAQEMMKQQGGVIGQTTPSVAGPAGGIVTNLPELLTPDQVAKSLGVNPPDVMSIIDSGELKAKKIGASYRIKRSALDAYLDAD